ncbi:MAG TPA: coproporphyrinogen dehydrogenase HemZ [Syntrophomonadaceae bacterium]|nr:coproporphyrinogen dehydrogenase HemZ [Syntrophomonadaceae bacterium]HQA06812.1 coproporphyrinogen dehydrogenase HemZ [Syntrophomonadaceae bacterium]HQE22744.1 coproporphyrinogen dehydrogenase HemZ [Syntrophomonadaceae bacterium]
MLIQTTFQPAELYEAVHELIRMAYPKHDLTREESPSADVKLHIQRDIDGQQVFFNGWIITGDQRTARKESYPLDVTEGDERRRHINRLTRRFAYDLLVEHTGHSINSYGILTGMRPVKLVHRMLERGISPIQIREQLRNDFRMSPEKADLIIEVASNNYPFIVKGPQAYNTIGLYVGIPFCPTRCYYCSFPGAVYQPGDSLRSFLTALVREMEGISQCLKETGRTVQSIYIGGGTPTVLSEDELDQLFNHLHRLFISPATLEITVEAGRPDTLSPMKLRLLKDAGASRICINPQTMNNETLAKIGRAHDREGVVRSVNWAREADFRQINMDLIVGLPDEGRQDYQHTAEDILKLAPENITVHTLAVKRGSRMAEQEGRESVGERIKTVQDGLAMMETLFRESSYKPYYLYRQKYMQASMENVGYSLPGHFCLYNINMIEEKQTIIGIGGGAASKFVNPSDGGLKSFYNPKNPVAYAESVDRLIAAKVDNLKTVH